MATPHGHAVYPGSFDPPTNGHLDVVARAAQVFATLTVAVVVNPQKRSPYFRVEERKELLRRCTAQYANVRVEHFRGLLADYVKEIGADVIVKGLRVVSDFESEMAFAHMNRSLAGVDTMFLMSDSSYSFVSSSLIKEVFLQGGDVTRYVPAVVLEYMNTKRHANGRT
ncbi:MAG: pantetheine-phosphate adenylyltransferase [Candidatus Eremiobacteraeota bacterium]|nr:pantetheine-phosphate adenylyltransferase [Candidatus Eremiobacteraeota bacterium]MBC5801594.1 pantetheine-phosphate adenylyltransferase [Candidatus Eremiobacteraeota bacterium]MBC5822642.1 pantetheine-phosphate adenylyltransferase [Candidatus Eremiobacteraeota bacterium]